MAEAECARCGELVAENRRLLRLVKRLHRMREGMDRKMQRMQTQLLKLEAERKG